MKKLLSVLLALCLVLSLAACGGNDSPAGADNTQAATENGGAENGGEENNVAADTKVAVFYYTYGDAYISSVRAALDAELDASGLAYQDYDSNGSQTTQTEQVQTAIASGATILVVNLVDSGSDDAAQNIIDQAAAKDIPVIFFNRSVSESVITGYDKAAFVGTDYEEAGHMQGQLVGEYLVEHYDEVDLNGDGVISYVMLKGEEANAEAIARTQFGQEDADAILVENGKPALAFYDSNNSNKYLLDQSGQWSSAAAVDLLGTALSQYNGTNGNMIELVISNNDDMALGAITALQNVGYNLGDGSSTTIPIFGVDATEAGKAAIANGTMTGTIKQDALGMANAIATIAGNYASGNETFEGVTPEYVVGNWRVNIPYGFYTGEE